MSTITERISADLPLAAIPAAVEVANMSGGKIKPALADMAVQRNADVPRNPNTAINEDQFELLSDVMEIWNQTQLQGGIIPATLLNMHPWQLKATGPHNEGITIPACPVQDEWHRFVQTSYRNDYGDRWGKFKVRPVWPIVMMRDFQQQHFAWLGGERPWGGIVVYMGDAVPGQVNYGKVSSFYDKILGAVGKIKDADTKLAIEEIVEAQRREQMQSMGEKLSEAEIRELIRKARETQISAYEGAFEKAEQSYSSWKAAKGGYPIGTVQRQIARWLHYRRRIAKLPEWITETKPVGWVEQKCPKCGSSIEEHGYACKACGRISKPFAAFKDGAITKDDPAMKRCTREELDSIGLSELLTLEEELATVPEKDSKKPKK